ncbi:hypothetical protein DPEC_G00089600 [Dallia pectoralis]|uniref:Uncharacterized protein n=1 Tax=Dallia pectoralis TaxID=75939 RepID=A0ACC2H183_DALPE|nr:hypothetical protein DPEC_G00089600 [Dallia pectoralis]
MVARHLTYLVQEDLARGSKTRALQRALAKLFETGLDHSPLELGDLLFQTFLEEFPTVRPCMTDGFLENCQLCLELSAMVSRVLLKFWTPRISFSKICEVREITPRLHHRQLDAIEPWSSTEDLGQSADDTDSANGYSVAEVNRTSKRKAVYQDLDAGNQGPAKKIKMATPLSSSLGDSTSSDQSTSSEDTPSSCEQDDFTCSDLCSICKAKLERNPHREGLVLVLEEPTQSVE